MYESEDKMVSHPEHYMSKTGMFQVGNHYFSRYE